MNAPARIALFNCQPIGDTVLTTPVARLLKAAYPNARLDMVMDARTADVFRHNPFVDRLITLDTRTRGKIPRWLAVLREVRAARYDLALNLSTNEGYSGLAALCGARRTCGFSTPALAWRFRPLARPFDPGLHAAEANVAMLKDMGVPVDRPYTTEMWVDPASHARADDLWQAEGLPEEAAVVAVNVGAGRPEKRWPTSRIAELVERLRREGLTPALVGGPGDVPLAAEALASLERPCVSLAGKTSLLTLAALMTRFRVFVTADTGPMHMASAMKTPTVALFGPTDPRGYGPFDVPHRVVQPPSGAGMSGITPEAVLAAVSDLLAEAPPAVPCEAPAARVV